ncbi:hypothetical protein AB0M61_40470 [Streptomyces sp. NPDC051642]|uniref:hypothetical protein n=1 Tax=Streptomyces sp. NPDC051642 TaxID=3154646 RepID=UPI003419F554
MLGLIVCRDLGGALYKIAYGYALAGINTAEPTPPHPHPLTARTPHREATPLAGTACP